MINMTYTVAGLLTRTQTRLETRRDHAKNGTKVKFHLVLVKKKLIFNSLSLIAE